jgi:hypothetical protein
MPMCELHLIVHGGTDNDAESDQHSKCSDRSKDSSQDHGDLPEHPYMSAIDSISNEEGRGLTLLSISRGIGHCNLHPGWWLSGEPSPSLIHETRPLIILLSFNTYFEVNSLICILLQLRESSSDDINRFLHISFATEGVLMMVTHLGIPT